MQDLIIVKQLPQIEEHLKELSTEIDKKVESAKALVCTEENVKTIKQVRADLNKEFKEVETQRKAVKEQIMKPYNEFETVYKEYISEKYNGADSELNEKINAVEDELKTKKEQEIKDYFEEYKTANSIDFVTYEQANINVTLTASKKNLKEQVEQFINQRVDDLKLIETQEHKAEILVEYKQTLNVSNAITTVVNRFKAIEKEKQIQEELKEKELEQITKPLETAKPKPITDEFVITPTKRRITVNFNLYDEQIEQLRRFLNLSNIEYESEDL